MKYTISLSFQAMADIQATYKWHEENVAPAKALAWYEGLTKALTTLADNPLQYSLADETGAFGYELRQMLYGKRKSIHRVLFTIQDNAIDVIAVRHASRGELQP